ncbi:hypothetical protein AB0B28_00380 [Glycomyces sp. NPDC046736]|uniref:hypothetical protein n=1 Tax=Glycomyces sp. NPDC046736 TaxID=3155615 RepID=UPI0033D40A9E
MSDPEGHIAPVVDGGLDVWSLRNQSDQVVDPHLGEQRFGGEPGFGEIALNTLDRLGGAPGFAPPFQQLPNGDLDRSVGGSGSRFHQTQ